MDATSGHGNGPRLHRRLVARLLEQADDVRRLASGLSEDQLAQRTVPGKWSIKELICHLDRVQEVFEQRISAMLAEENPQVTLYVPEEDAAFPPMTAHPASETLADFLRKRTRLAARLESLVPEQWHRPGRHPDYKAYDVHFQVEAMVHHEAHHIYQMFERRAPFGRLPH